MARPKVLDYDPAYDETIVTAGVEGAVCTWFGIGVDRQVIHIVCNEGPLVPAGDEIAEVIRRGQQVTLDGAEASAFYAANKTAIDDIIRAALLKWADVNGKSGTVIET